MPRTALLVTGFSRECSLCRQLVDENTQREDSSNAWLFGHDAYALCPRCLQEVPEDLRTSRYRRGWDKLADRLLKGRDQPHAGAKPSLSSTQLREGAIAVTAEALAGALQKQIVSAETALYRADAGSKHAQWVHRRQELAWELFLCFLAGSGELKSENLRAALFKKVVASAAKTVLPSASRTEVDGVVRQARAYSARCSQLAYFGNGPQAILEGVCDTAIRRIMGLHHSPGARERCLDLAKRSLGSYRAVIAKAKTDLDLR